MHREAVGIGLPDWPHPKKTDVRDPRHQAGRFVRKFVFQHNAKRRRVDLPMALGAVGSAEASTPH